MIQLIEEVKSGHYAVRWNIKPIYENNEIVKYSYEEHIFDYIPNIKDIQSVITEYFNKQTDLYIKYGFKWNGRQVYLSDENKFNFKAIIDEAARVETSIKIWDDNNPELAGINYTTTESENDNGEKIEFTWPTGRPTSLLPITLKLGIDNIPENFYVFTKLEELQEFFNLGVQHLINAYAQGWGQIATFDFSEYQKILDTLK